MESVNWRGSLKTRVLATILASLLTVGVTLSVRTYIKSQERLAEKTESSVAMFQKILSDQIVVKGRDLSMAMETLLLDRNVVQAFMRKDRETLSSLLLEHYRARLKPVYGIGQFQFHLPPATSFFRVHKPGKFDDDLSAFRKTVLAVNAQKKPVVGIEVGRAGPGLRIVYPVFDGERHVGSVEFGSSLQSIFSTVADITGTQFALGVKQEVFKTARRFTDTKNDVVHGDLVFYKFSVPEAKSVVSSLAGGSLQRSVELEGRQLMTHAFPIADFSKREIGQVLVIQDVGGMIGEARNQLVTQVLVIAAASILTALLIFWILSRSLLAPINRNVQVVGEVAKGDLTKRIPVSENANELDLMAANANQMFGGMAGNVRRIVLQSDSVAACANELLQVKTTLDADARETSDAMERAEEEFQRLESAVTKIRDDVQGATGRMEEVSQAAEQLSNDIVTIASAAEEASQNVTNMASASEEMTANLGAVNDNLEAVNNSSGSVASAVEEMTATLDEVRKRCLSANRESEKAAQHTQSTLGVMDRLSESATEIGKFIELINNIADQTNMLALNASIEAAGAGEAGKGFAVVANEVKELARQTAEATRLIAEQVGRIQDHSKEASVATREVTGIVGDINSANQEITMAVDEQNAAIREISRAISSVAAASSDVTRNASELREAADEVSRAAAEAAAGANEIAQFSSTAANAAQNVYQRNQEANGLVQSILDATDITASVAETAKENIHTASAMADYMAGSVNNFSILVEVVQGAVEALRASQVSYVTGPKSFDVRLVKEGHLVWLRRLEQAARGRLRIEPEEAGNFKGCAFGKWYFGEGRELYADYPKYAEIGVVHEQVHTTAVEVLTRINAGDKGGGIEAMATFGRLRIELFNMLDELYMADVVDNQVMIHWDDSLDVGVKQFNEDHQRLMELINELHAAMKNGLGKSRMGEILAALTEFTQTHFAREEGMMKKHGYDRYPTQKEEHVRLIAQLGEKQALFEAGSATVALELLAFLQDWLIEHIKGEDMRYKSFFKTKGVS